MWFDVRSVQIVDPYRPLIIDAFKTRRAPKGLMLVQGGKIGIDVGFPSLVVPPQFFELAVMPLAI